MRIIQTAAKLIKSDIKSIDTSRENYPSSEHMADSDAALNYLSALELSGKFARLSWYG